MSKTRLHSCPRCGGRLEEDFHGKWVLEFVDLEGDVQADEALLDMSESYRFLTCENSHDVLREMHPVPSPSSACQPPGEADET